MSILFWAHLLVVGTAFHVLSPYEATARRLPSSRGRHVAEGLLAPLSLLVMTVGWMSRRRDVYLVGSVPVVSVVLLLWFGWEVSPSTAVAASPDPRGRRIVLPVVLYLYLTGLLVFRGCL